jgi:minichromosome maintenance protein 10
MGGPQKRKGSYDPQRKWGLSPADGSAAPSSAAIEGATYVVEGHIVAGGKRDLFLNETVGREAQARAARLAGSRDADMALKKLLARDKEGMKAVQVARRFAKTARAKQIADGHEKRKDKGDVDECGSEEEGESDDDELSNDKPTKNAYSAQVIKRLGFDPTLKSSRGRRADDDPTNMYSKVTFFFIMLSSSRWLESSTNDLIPPPPFFFFFFPFFS